MSRHYSSILLLLLLGSAGCGRSKPADRAAIPKPVQPPMVRLDASAPAEPPPPEPTAPVAAAPVDPASAPSESVAAQLAVVQQGIETFKAKNGRSPYNVEELMNQKIITQLPKLPPNKIYVIDYDIGRVRVGNFP